jgi:metallo-beta-lactamase family protein
MRILLMKIEFSGAAGCVTGSCHMLKVNEKTLLLDCGLYQGKDEKERGNDVFNFNPKEVDYVILSHAHIDHSGRIPLLYKRGFKGEVICTEATRELCSVMLPDSGHIAEMEIEWRNRKRIRQGMEPVEPIYTAKIAELSMYLFRGVNYDETIELFDGLKLRFRDAGHLLGAGIVELFIQEEGKKEVKIVYSGDIGNINIPLIKDPTYIDYADYVLMESTYGNRLHDNITSSMEQLVQIIKDTFRKGGNVIIPSFAVGRTQEVIYALNKYVGNDMLKNITVYVDSPLATESTRIFKKYSDEYDDEAKALLEKGDNPLEFEGLVFTESPEDSMRVNKIQSGAVVISASGMCEAGRIKHHLKHNLWRKECSIVFAGYQAEGTVGRAIVDGSKKVRIFGEEIAVNAQIYYINGLSGHADREGLLKWLRGFRKRPKEVLLVHGDREAQNSFKALLKDKGYKARIMELGEKFYINEEAANTVDAKVKIIRYLSAISDEDNISKSDLLDEIKKLLEE